MQKIKWGIISTGRIANKFASDFSHVKNGELLAIASREMSKASEFAANYNIPKAFGSYSELFDDPEIDAIYVATPHNFHKQNTLDALKGGKAVLCEKPITVNPEEFDAVRAEAQSSGNYLMEGMWTYFLPAIQKAKKWVSEGRIGRVRHITANFGFQAPFDPQRRLFDPDLAGGSLLDVGIYPIAIAWLFIKEDPKEIIAKASKAGTGVDDDVVMLFEYPDTIASLHCSIKYQLFNHAIIIGEEGYIQIPDFWQAEACFLFKGKENILEDHFKAPRQSVGFDYEIESMNADLLGKRTESKIMPLDFSQKLQEHMKAVMEKF